MVGAAARRRALLTASWPSTDTQATTRAADSNGGWGECLGTASTSKLLVRTAGCVKAVRSAAPKRKPTMAWRAQLAEVAAAAAGLA